ncbi:hypothetical protein PPH41_39005 [Burkholderia gladioli]|nr:hypothetical protein [Burkholderia gladioli]
MSTPPTGDTGTPPTGGKRILDMTVNVQSLVMAILGGVVSIVLAYFAVISRVDKIEAHSQTQDDRMTRIEQTQIQQKSDTNQQLRDISSDVSYIRNYLLNNAAGSRDDTRRWSK